MKEERLPTEREALVRFLTELGEPCAATLEAGYNWGLVYDWLEEAGVVEELKLAHPLWVKASVAPPKAPTIPQRPKTRAAFHHTAPFLEWAKAPLIAVGRTTKRFVPKATLIATAAGTPIAV